MTLNRTTNNFDFLRIAAAVAVIFSHSFSVSGFTSLEPLGKVSGGTISLGTLAVIVFFVLSGYLITQSWQRKPEWKRFLRARILRIVPGLVLLATFTIFVIGPLCTSLPLTQYFTSMTTWGYYQIALVFGSISNFIIPGVFDANPLHGAGYINASIWTLPYEFKMYLLVMFLGVVGILYNRRLVLLVTIAAFLVLAYAYSPWFAFLKPLEYISSNLGITQTMEGINSASIFPLFFLIGSLFFLYADKIRLDWRVALLLFAVWSYVTVDPFFKPVYWQASMLLLPYVIITISWMKLPFINNASRYGDLSYGLYIFAFPVQQAIVDQMGEVGPIELFIIAMLILLPLAFMSWHLVEKRALELKNVDVDLLRVFTTNQQIRRLKIELNTLITKVIKL